MRPCDESIRSTLVLVDKMLELADEGDHVREDNGCGVLYSVLRDSAYKIGASDIFMGNPNILWSCPSKL
jgi:hypothetical protein